MSSKLRFRWLPLLTLPVLVAAGCFGSSPTARLAVTPARNTSKTSAVPFSSPRTSTLGKASSPAATPTPLWPSPIPSFPTVAAQPVTVQFPAGDDGTTTQASQNMVVLSMANVTTGISVQMHGTDVSQAGDSTVVSAASPPSTVETLASLDQRGGIRAFEDARVTPYIATHPQPYHLQAVGTTLKVGAQVPFWVITDFDTANYKDVAVTARVADVGEHCYVLIDTSIDKDPAQAAALEAKAKSITTIFDSSIYPTNTRIFGSEPNPGVDNDPHLFILLSPAVGNYGTDSTLGFFSQRDEFEPTAGSPAIFQHSNAKEMLYISSNIVATGSDEDYLGTISHEFQHMINFNQKVLIGGNHVSEDLWIDEGMAMYAIEANGYGLRAGGQVLGNHVKKFQQEPAVYSLTDWPNNPDQSGYGAVYLFMVYMADRYGEAIIHDIVSSPKEGTANLDAVLRARGTAFNRLFHDWCLTNVIDPIPQNDMEDYRYKSLRMIGANGKTTLAGFSTDVLNIPGNVTLQARPYNMRVYNLPSGDLTPNFSFTATTDALSEPPVILAPPSVATSN